MSVLTGQLLVVLVTMVLLLVFLVVAIRFLLAATRLMNRKAEALEHDAGQNRRSLPDAKAA